MGCSEHSAEKENYSTKNASLVKRSLELIMKFLTQEAKTTR